MIDPAMRSLAVTPAPVPGALPTPPDHLPTPTTQQQAHPFAELLRQNRLAATASPRVPAQPPAASDASADRRAAPASEDSASTAIEPPSSQRDAAPAKGRAAAPSRSASPPATTTAPSCTDASENDARARGDDAAATTAQAPDASTLAATLASARPETPASSDATATDRGPNARTKAAALVDASSPLGAANAAASTTGADPSAPDAAAARRIDRSAADAATQRSVAVDAAKAPELGLVTFAETLAESKVAHESRATAPSDFAGIGATALAPSSTGATTNGASSAAAATASASLATPVDSAEFAAAFGSQVSIFVREGVQRAELHLHPVDMGPVSVSITLDGTQARVDFGADLAATRHAIEAGLPALASALSDAGFTLAGGGVAQHSRPNGGDTDASGADRSLAQRDGSARVDGVEVATAAPRARHVALGGVDLYA